MRSLPSVVPFPTRTSQAEADDRGAGDARWRRFALVVFGCFGTLYALLTPPCQFPDEGPHFMRVWALSTGAVLPDTSGPRPAALVPSSLAEFCRKSLAARKEKAPYRAWYAESRLPLPKAKDDPLVPAFHLGARHSPVLYAPQVLAQWIGRALFIPKLRYYNWQNRLLMARLGSLACGLAVAAWCLRRLPALRLSIVAIVLLPMTVMISSAVTADTVLAFASLAFVTAAVGCRIDGRIGRADRIAMLLAALCLASGKIVYLPVLCTVGVLWRRVPGADFRRLVAEVAVVAGVGLALTIGLFMPLTPSPAKEAAQVAHLTANWQEFILVPLRTLDEQRLTYINGMCMCFGLLDTSLPLPAIFIVLWTLLGIFVLEGAASGIRLSRRWSAACLALGAASVYLILLSTYVVWTSCVVGIGAPVVEGVQGRYFIPLLPLVALACHTGWLPESWKSRAASLADVLPWVFLPVHALCAFAVLARYWL
jgi:uncharacterized membrane protein